MALTAAAVRGTHSLHHPAWWVAGVAFIGLELVVHLLMHSRGRGSFYNGRG
jgi:hypothetical protein